MPVGSVDIGGSRILRIRDHIEKQRAIPTNQNKRELNRIIAPKLQDALDPVKDDSDGISIRQLDDAKVNEFFNTECQRICSEVYDSITRGQLTVRRIMKKAIPNTICFLLANPFMKLKFMPKTLHFL